MSPTEPPPMLGPFRTRGRQYESEYGMVLNGEAPDGLAVELVRLGPGPSSDPAVRDRFRASVAGLDAQVPGSVLAADLDSPSPWVALAHGVSGVVAPPGGPALVSAGPAIQLLAAAVPTDFQAVPSHGPQFSPYWRGRRPADGLAPAGVVAVPGLRWRRWAVAAFILLVLLLLLLWWLLSRPIVQVPQPTPSPVPTVPLLSPTPSMPGPGSPSPVPSVFQSDVPVLLHPLLR